MLTTFRKSFSVEDSEMFCECNPADCATPQSPTTTSSTTEEPIGTTQRTTSRTTSRTTLKTTTRPTTTTTTTNTQNPVGSSCRGGLFTCWIFSTIVNLFG